MSAPIAFAKTVTVDGDDVDVVAMDLGGQGPVRLFVTNSGGAALSAGKVQLAASVDGPWEDLDTSTFGTLGSGVTKSLVIAKPVGAIRFLASCASSTTLDAQCLSGLQD